MTRRECEDRLLALLGEAEGVYRDFAPGGDGFSMSCVGGQLELIGFGGGFAATRFQNGEVWRWGEEGNR